MIYTVTLNPSLDYIIHLNEFRTGEINKSKKQEIMAGGKGINVSIVLRNLGYDTVAMGFVAGFTGNEIEYILKNRGIHTDFIHIGGNGYSRINIKLLSDVESEINCSGPFIQDEYFNALLNRLDAINENDILILSGSIANGLSTDTYERILSKLQSKSCRVVLDTTGESLSKCLKYGPFLIKPNDKELGEIFGVEIKTKDDAILYAKQLRKLGARNVLVTMAAEGAVLIDETDRIHMSLAPKGTLVNSVGAGDASIAGFIYGYLASGDYRQAFNFAVAAGSASAFSSQLAMKEDIVKLLEQIQRQSD